MNIKIELLQDTIFGSGVVTPEGYSSIIYDDNGFPYLRGSTLKGVLREEMTNYLSWTGGNESEIIRLFGTGGKALDDDKKLYISDCVIPHDIKQEVYNMYSSFENSFNHNLKIFKDDIFEAFTTLRTFTALENGLAKDGSLRTVRCIKKGVIFCGHIDCDKQSEELITEVLGCVKWLGSMRSRGFGKVKITVM